MELSIKRYYAWLGFSLCFSLAIQFILPFPYGLIIALILLVVIPFYFRKRLSRGLMSTAASGFTAKVNFICTVCDKKTNKRECPRCGSMSFRAV